MPDLDDGYTDSEWGFSTDSGSDIGSDVDELDSDGFDDLGGSLSVPVPSPASAATDAAPMSTDATPLSTSTLPLSPAVTATTTLIPSVPSPSGTLPSTHPDAASPTTSRPRPTPIDESRLSQSQLSSFFSKITRDEAEQHRISTKGEREAEARDREQYVRRQVALAELGKKTRKKEKEKEKKRRYRQRVKERKVRLTNL